MSNDIERLREYIEDISPAEEEKFTAYFEILSQFNKKINLVSESTIHDAGKRHFADSYHGIKIFQDEIKENSFVYDFGSGNGFPGIVFSIMRPDCQMMLVERDQRKCEFLKFVSQELGLGNINIHSGNASHLKPGVVDVAISRAMAPMPKMLLEVREALGKNAHLFLFKGDHWTTEFGQCPPQIFDLWDVTLKGTYRIPELDIERFVIDCQKL